MAEGVFDAALIEGFEGLARDASQRSWPQGGSIFVEGDPADSVFLVISGRVRIFVSDGEGKELELAEVGPRQYFGESAVVAGTEAGSVRVAGARALTPVQAWVIEPLRFREALMGRPALALHVIGSLVSRARAMTRKVRDLALLDVYRRVSQLLNETAIEIEGRRVAPYMSQQTMAERVVSSRSMVNRVLKELIEGGYVSIDRQGIVILRPLPPRW